jgi:hypothetical protein
LNEGKSALGGLRETCMKTNLGLGPDARRTGPAEVQTFRRQDMFALGVLYRGVKHGRVVTLSGVEVKNE